MNRSLEELQKAIEYADALTTKERKDLRKDQFAFPKQRKMPLSDCSHVRNAMARFNQVEGVSNADRRKAYKKILRFARRCDIDASGFIEKFGKKYG